MCFYLYGSLYGDVTKPEYESRHDPNDPMIIELSNMISDFSKLPGFIQINICKTWTGRQNKREIKLKLNEIDLREFLADLQENTLYCLSL